MVWLMLALGVVIGALSFWGISYLMGKKVGEKASEIVNEARREAEKIRQEARLEVEREVLKRKEELEEKLRQKREALFELEKKLARSEAELERKLEQTLKKEKELSIKEKAIEEKERQISREREKLLQELQRIARISVEEARAELFKQVEAEAKNDAMRITQKIIEEAQRSAQQKAKEIIVTAIQRLAPEVVSENTVAVVHLPNDEMKGRIIGREGRNIRTFESLTGVDLIIDDTPEAVVISSYDPVRREIARIALERLVADGRVHPARIEEVVQKVEKEFEETLYEDGERVAMELGFHDIHPEILKLLGRLKYRTSYGQNVLAHSIEVANIAAMIAAELGADVELAKRGGLLHDIGKAVPQEVEGAHAMVGAQIARKYRESPEVVNIIASHHGDVEPATIEAVIVQAADAISAARPGARKESFEAYVKRIKKLEEIASSFEGVEKAYAIQAGREVRVIVLPSLVSDEDLPVLATEIARKIEREVTYPGQVKVVVIRETREEALAR